MKTGTIYQTNIGDVSTGGSTRVIEGKMINEYYMLQPYKGSGNGFNADGTVNINGGPRDGMIRTVDDMKWLECYGRQGISSIRVRTSVRVAFGMVITSMLT